MRWWRSDRKEDGLRGHVRIGLPLNPICWLFGHFPKATIEGGTGHRWLLVACRVCDRRYKDRDLVTRALKGTYSGDELKRMTEQRLAAAERDLDRWAADRKGRAGYEDDTELDIGYQLVWKGRGSRRNGWTSAGASISFGGPGSETPIDFHFGTGLFALFITIGGVGHRFAGWLSNRTGERYGESRELGVSIHGWRAYRSIWTKKHSRSRADGWRSGSTRLHPLDILWGDRRYAYDDVATATAFVTPATGGEYLVDLKLQSCRHGRPRGGRQRYGWSVDWECRQGIPERWDDGWKGGSVYGSGVTLEPTVCVVLPPAPDDWATTAARLIAERVDRERERNGFRLADA